MSAPPTSAARADESKCGATFTAVVDTRADASGVLIVAPIVDTVRVCAGWTGTDMQLRMITLGSSVAGRANRGILYQNGVGITAIDATGQPIRPTIKTRGTMFDALRVDDRARQAFSVDPYAAIFARDAELSAASSGTNSRSKASLARPSAIALTFGAREVENPAAGTRQFERDAGGIRHVVTMDATREIELREEITGPGTAVTVQHEWAKAEGGFLRVRTTLRSSTTMGNRTISSVKTITISDAHLSAGR